jgi:hypothetical protein
MRLWAILFLSILLLSFSGTDTVYPQDDFIWPVKQAIRVSGTFGELRPNHFHAGVDLKSSKGASGDRLYAAAEGYISRIKVQAGGYGNALYITHPNGYTTVYAHLLSFTEDVAEYVKAQQYEQESFEVDLYPLRDRFVLEQGAFIGKMGSTGSSFGPHLHFEIRDSQTEKPINPLLFGLEIPDRKPPRLHQVKVYGFDTDFREYEDQAHALKQRSDVYRVSGDTLTTAFAQVGLAIKAFDHHDNVTNWNGIYGLELRVDGEVVFQFDINSFSFDETRYVNALLDYRERLTNRSYFYRCFRQSGNQLSFLANNPAYGLIDLSDGQTHQVSLRVYDAQENFAESEFWIRGGPGVAGHKSAPYNYFLPHSESHLIQTDDYVVYFPAGVFYDDLFLQLSTSQDGSYGQFSDVLHVQDEFTPVHRYFDIALRPNREMTEEERRMAYIAFCDSDGTIVNVGGDWEENGMLHAKSRDLGNFAILLDRKPPKVENVSVRSDMRGRSSMSVKITDNLPTGRNVETLQYRATIDEEWVLMEYDRKSDRLTYRVDGQIPPGSHLFRLEVSDAVGNKTVFERTIRF